MLTVAGILEILSQILVHKIRSHMVLGVKVGSDEKSKNTDSFVSNKGVSLNLVYLRTEHSVF